jgi:hypothetical protein
MSNAKEIMTGLALVALASRTEAVTLALRNNIVP